MSFGLDLADRVHPRVTVARPLGGASVGRLGNDVCRFSSRIGLSHLQRQQLDARDRADVSDLTVKPPIDWWPWPDEEPAPVHQPSVQAVVASGDRKLDALRRMLADGTSARPAAAALAPANANRDWRPPRRGLPRAVRRSSTTAGPGTVPGALAERLQPESVDPQAVAESNAARVRGGQSRTTGSAGADRPIRQDDKVNRLRRMLEKSGRVAPSSTDGGAVTPAVGTSSPTSSAATATSTSTSGMVDSSGAVSQPTARVGSPFGRSTGADDTGDASDPPGRARRDVPGRPFEPAMSHVARTAATSRPATPIASSEPRSATSTVPTPAIEALTARWVRPSPSQPQQGIGVDAPVTPSALPLASLVRRSAAERIVAAPMPITGSIVQPIAGSIASPIARRAAPTDASVADVVAGRPSSWVTAAGQWVAAPSSSADASEVEGLPLAPKISVVQRTVPEAISSSTRRRANTPDAVAAESSADAASNQGSMRSTGRAGSFLAAPPTIASSIAAPSPATAMPPTPVPPAPVPSTPAPTSNSVPRSRRTADVPLPGLETESIEVSDPAHLAASLQRTMDDAPRSMPVAEHAESAAASSPGTISARSRSASNQPQNVAVVRRRTRLARSAVESASGPQLTVGVASSPAVAAPRQPDIAVADTSVTAPPVHRAVPAAAIEAMPALEVGERFLGELARAPRSTPRPLPTRLQPLARAVVGDLPVRVSTDTASRAALASVGKVAATTGDVVHLQRMPSTAADHAVFAHELVHAAHPSPQPRFFDDDRPSPEERQAEQVAQIIRRAPVLPRASAAAEPRLQRMPVAPATLSPRPAPPAVTSTEPGTLSAAALAARFTGGSSGGGSSSTAGVGTIQRTPAATIQRAPTSSDTIRRALGDDGIASAQQSGNFPYDLTAVERRRFVQWLVENLGDRMLEELERRGGRFRGEF